MCRIPFVAPNACLSQCGFFVLHTFHYFLKGFEREKMSSTQIIGWLLLCFASKPNLNSAIFVVVYYFKAHPGTSYNVLGLGDLNFCIMT